MSLYTMSAPEAELTRLAGEPDRLNRVTMAHTMGRFSAFAPGVAAGGAPPSEAAFKQQLKQIDRAAWRQVVLAWLLVQFVKGSLRKRSRIKRSA
jgi:hypothetical protein